MRSIGGRSWRRSLKTPRAQYRAGDPDDAGITQHESGGYAVSLLTGVSDRRLRLDRRVLAVLRRGGLQDWARQGVVLTFVAAAHRDGEHLDTVHRAADLPPLFRVAEFAAAFAGAGDHAGAVRLAAALVAVEARRRAVSRGTRALRDVLSRAGHQHRADDRALHDDALGGPPHPRSRRGSWSSARCSCRSSSCIRAGRIGYSAGK